MACLQLQTLSYLPYWPSWTLLATADITIASPGELTVGEEKGAR